MTGACTCAALPVGCGLAALSGTKVPSGAVHYPPWYATLRGYRGLQGATRDDMYLASTGTASLPPSGRAPEAQCIPVPVGL